MSNSKKYYVVWVGREPGVYETWAECQEQTKGFSKARYKAFSNIQFEEAMNIFKNGEEPPAQSIQTNGVKSPAPTTTSNTVSYPKGGISVDAACAGNPGEMEYKAVWIDTKELIFISELYPLGTNNIGEFLALVEALKYSKEQNQNYTIYTDSQTALAWLRNKKTKSTLERNEKTEKLWCKLDEAIEWLNKHSYSNPVLKWDTKAWGEIPADFGRKSNSK